MHDAKVLEVPNDRTETYLQAIHSEIGPKLQLVVTVFPTSSDDRYCAVKKLCCIDSLVPSQVSDEGGEEGEEGGGASLVPRLSPQKWGGGESLVTSAVKVVDFRRLAVAVPIRLQNETMCTRDILSTQQKIVNSKMNL